MLGDYVLGSMLGVTDSNSGLRAAYLVQILPLLISWVTLSKLLNQSVPQFPHLQNGNNNSVYLIGLLWEST